MTPYSVFVLPAFSVFETFFFLIYDVIYFTNDTACTVFLSFNALTGFW